MIIYSDGLVDGPSKGPLIFLAGPTRRGIEPSITAWRREFCSIHSEACDFAIPEPHAGHWPDYEKQLNWETTTLRHCDKIFFWIPRSKDLPGLTTNVEFGEWFTNDKTYYGRPDDAEHCRYLDHRWKNYWASKPIVNNISDFKQFMTR